MTRSAETVTSKPDHTPRMDPLATLPVFFKLAAKRVVLAGGTDAALWKAELLAAAGAHVEVYAGTFVAGFAGLGASIVNGRVTLEQRRWQPSDLPGAALAIGAMTEDRNAEAFANACRLAGIPVNVIDRPAFCDFQFGAIVNRSPLVVAISTDGGAPVFGQAIRSLIESLLPDGFRHWAEAARVWRREPGVEAIPFALKRTFWTRFADLAMSDATRPPTGADREALLKSTTESASPQSGPVTIVTVGSNAETLTLAAVRALRSADVVLFEASIPLAVLEFARRESERHAFPPLGDNGWDALPENMQTVLLDANAPRRTVCLVAARPNEGGGTPGVDHPIARAITAAGRPVITL